MMTRDTNTHSRTHHLIDIHMSMCVYVLYQEEGSWWNHYRQPTPLLHYSPNHSTNTNETNDIHTICHQKLWDQVNVIISGSSKICWWFCIRASKLFIHLFQVQWGRLTTIVWVSVQVKYLLARDTQQSRDNTLSETSTKHYNIIGIVHFFSNQ